MDSPWSSPTAILIITRTRTDISIAQPSRAAGTGGALDLDGYFGLNPALAPLLPLYQQGHLAAIQACGSPQCLPLPFRVPGPHGIGRR